LILTHAQLQRRGTGLINQSWTKLLGQGEDTENAAHTSLALTLMNCLAKIANVTAGAAGALPVTEWWESGVRGERSAA